MFDRLEEAFTKFAAAMALAGGVGLLFATLVTCVSIILKMGNRILGSVLSPLPEALSWVRPILGEEELVTYGVGLALFSALPWVMIRKGHIKIDLFESSFGPQFNRVLDLLGDIALASIAYLILTRQWFLIFRKARRSEEPMTTELAAGNWSVVGDRLRDSQESQILGIALWPTYVVAEICVLGFFIVAVFCVLRSARALVSDRKLQS